MFGVEATKLALHINGTARSLSSIISTVRVSPKHNTAIEIREMLSTHTSTINAVARAMTTLLHAMDRLSQYPGSEQLTGNALFYCTEIFNSIFTTIEEAAVIESKTGLSSTRSRRAANKPQRQIQDNGSPHVSSAHSLMSFLTSLTHAIVSHFDTTKLVHAQMLEGLLHHLLLRLGEITHMFTFGGRRDVSISAEIRNLPDHTESELDPATCLERQAMAVEAPYMIAILRKAMTALPANCIRDLADGLSSKYYLTPIALRRLERTLVDSIFGPGSRGENCSEDVLRKPVLVNPELTSPRHDEEVNTNGSNEMMEVQWFTGELWDMIGWEILGRDEDL